MNAPHLRQSARLAALLIVALLLSASLPPRAAQPAAAPPGVQFIEFFSPL